MPKATNAEMERRITLIISLVIRGMKRREIIKYCMEKTDWKVSEHAIDKYLKRAAMVLKKIAEKDRQEEFGIAITRLVGLWNAAVNEGDIKTALAIQKEISETFGLKTTKIETTTKTKIEIDKDMKDAIKETIRKRNASKVQSP